MPYDTKEKQDKWYSDLKADPVKWAAHVKKREEYAEKNREIILERDRKRYAETRSDPVAWGRVLERSRKRLKIPKNKITHSCRIRLREITKGISFMESTMELCGIDSEGLKKHLESKFSPGMSWENYGRKGWHIDHIIPCARFDVTKIDELRACFHYTNLQPLWAFDNLSKGCK